MRKRRADWIDKRPRKTTNLRESSALVANDIVANMPSEDDSGQLTIVIEVGGGRVWDVFSNHPPRITVILVDHEEAEDDPGQSARMLEVCPLSTMGKESKALMFDAGLSLRKPT